MNRVVVTGSSGFVGRHLVDALHGEVDYLMEVDRKIGRDLADDKVLEQIFEFGPDTIFHLAADHFIPWCDAHPAETYENNVGTFLSLLRESYAQTIVLASSAAVYGFRDEPFWEDFSEQNPQGPYGKSKIMCEDALDLWSRYGGRQAVSLRLFNIVGPGDLTPHLFTKLRDDRRRGTSTTVGTLDAVRDYVHVEDVVEAFLIAARHDTGLPHLTANVCTEVGTTVEEVAKEFGFDEIKLGPGRAVEGNLVGSNAVFRSVTGWAPKRTWRDAVDELV